MAAGEGDGVVDGAVGFPVVHAVGFLADGAGVGGGGGEVVGGGGAEEVEFGDGCVEVLVEESGHSGEVLGEVGWGVNTEKSRGLCIVVLKGTDGCAESPRGCGWWKTLRVDGFIDARKETKTHACSTRASRILADFVHRKTHRHCLSASNATDKGIIDSGCPSE